MIFRMHQSLKGMSHVLSEAPVSFKVRKPGNYHRSRKMIGVRDLYQLLCSTVAKYLAETKEELFIQLKVSEG